MTTDRRTAAWLVTSAFANGVVAGVVAGVLYVAAEDTNGDRAGGDPGVAGFVLATPFVLLGALEVLLAVHVASGASRAGREIVLGVATTGAVVLAGLVVAVVVLHARQGYPVGREAIGACAIAAALLVPLAAAWLVRPRPTVRAPAPPRGPRAPRRCGRRSAAGWGRSRGSR